jgi:hypothetical protein
VKKNIPGQGFEPWTDQKAFFRFRKNLILRQGPLFISDIVYRCFWFYYVIVNFERVEKFVVRSFSTKNNELGF